MEDRGMKGDCTPLMKAASAGHSEIVKLLLSHNAEVNAQSSSGKYKYMKFRIYKSMSAYGALVITTHS